LAGESFPQTHQAIGIPDSEAAPRGSIVMRSQFVARLATCLMIGISSWIPAIAQTTVPERANLSEFPPVPSRVVERVDDTRLVKLAGNTHFLARAEFDKGLVNPQLPMERMILVLKRSPAQDAALQEFMAEQLNPKSSNFHHWLHADEFGQLYGPSDSDIAAITNWLQNHGFEIYRVAKGRTNIEFSGTAAQVQDAFHTEIHSYVIRDKMHIANDRDPQIPEALAPVVAGIASLHDFFPVHQSELGRFVTKNRKTGKVIPIGLPEEGPRSQYVFSDPNVGGVNNEDIGPYDFAAMYNLTPLWTAGITGKNVSIAIASETDINLKDIATFRSFFGLSKFTGTAKMLINGTDPGTIQGAVVENTLDTEWSGASAPDANVIVVASKGTATTTAAVLSISYIVDQEVAPIMSGSYGECEAGLGSAGNANLNSIYQQGSAEGISMFESAGDQGSTGCDNSDATTYPAPAQNGLQVNGFVSSPYITGVGGTDIVWQEEPYSKYWTANTTNNSSAIGYIPEIPWNSTCTSSYLLTYVYTGQTSSEELCNNAIGAGLDDMVRVVGGSGGKSSCLSNKGTFATCTGAYAKPSWQAGSGVPADKVRDVPDVSLFASSGLPSGNGGSAYLICVSSNSPDGKCDYTGDNIVAQEVGGTSVSSPAMAGIMALVDQKAGSAQGLANPVFYQLAAKESLSSCNSNTVTNGNSCIFYDITTGTNAMPCLTGSLNCVVNTSGDQIGIVTGYSTTTGYDLATGLGSVNAYNLVQAWPTTTTATVTVSPTTYAFPATVVGATSATKGLITVKNTGTAAVSFSTVSFTGTNASSFTQSTTCPVGATLAAAASCTVTVSFHPATAGSLTATLNITDGAGTQKVSLSGAATAAATTVSVSPASLAFASTAVGATTAAQLVTIKNTGTASVSLTSENLTGTNATSFVKSATTCTTALAVGAICTVSVEFKPTVAGALTASLSIADNATGTPQLVALKGTATAAPLTVAVSPATLTFASTKVGVTTAAQLVTIKNTSATAITLTSETLTGTNATSFVKSATTCTTSLAAAASCTVSIEFKPTVAGALTASLSIADNATGTPQLVTLKGTAVAATTPTVTLTPASIAFPATILGTTTDAQIVTLKNTSTVSVTLTSIVLGGTNPADFEELTNCGASLAASATCSIYVAFKPVAAAAYSGTISVTDNATGSPQKITLTGTGAAAPSVTLSTKSLTFASTTHGTTSAAQTVTLKNSGTATINLTSITLSGTSATSYEVLDTCGPTLAGGASCMIYVAFKPTTTGTLTATLNIADNGSASPQTVALTGTGK
jgi:hypothetical protein